MKVVTKEAVKVETGLKTVAVTLQSSVVELRARAWERLKKRGPLLVDGLRVGASSFTIALRGPYTICWMGTQYGEEMVTAIGAAKRNPVDRRNLSVGATLAVYRAWRDFWVQAAQLEKTREAAKREADEIGWDPGKLYPVMAETLERVREVVAETPF